MRYEWDPQKDVLNQRKHGLRLKDGIPALEDPVELSWIDDRFDYHEIRFITLGLGSDGVLYVVSTEPDDNLVRIISVRRAKHEEIQWYEFGRA
jgi:uncharacterized protein